MGNFLSSPIKSFRKSSGTCFCEGHKNVFNLRLWAKFFYKKQGRCHFRRWVELFNDEVVIDLNTPEDPMRKLFMISAYDADRSKTLDVIVLQGMKMNVDREYIVFWKCPKLNKLCAVNLSSETISKPIHVESVKTATKLEIWADNFNDFIPYDMKKLIQLSEEKIVIDDITSYINSFAKNFYRVTQYNKDLKEVMDVTIAKGPNPTCPEECILYCMNKMTKESEEIILTPPIKNSHFEGCSPDFYTALSVLLYFIFYLSSS